MVNLRYILYNTMKRKGVKSVRRSKPRQNKKTRALKTKKRRTKKGGKRRKMVQTGGGMKQLVEAILERDIEKSLKSVQPDQVYGRNTPFVGPFGVNVKKKLRSTIDAEGDLDVVNVGDTVTVSKIERSSAGLILAYILPKPGFRGGYIQTQYLSPNPQITLGRTPLYLACRSPTPHADIVELLLDNGFNPNITNDDITGARSTPLHGLVQAIKDNHSRSRINDTYLAEIVKILILLRNKQCNVSAKNISDLTAFQEFTGQYTANGTDLYAANGGLYGILVREFASFKSVIDEIHRLLDPMPPPSMPPPSMPHLPQSWFGKIFEFEENQKGISNFNLVKQNVAVNSMGDGDITLITRSKKQLHAGKFTMDSLEKLHRELPPAQPAQTLSYNEMDGDIKLFHQNKLLAGSLFQVASQFNMLEMVTPKVTPSHGITMYKDDMTQGPACAMACPAGTLFRNYFVNGSGQDTPEHQLDGLRGALTVLQGTVGHSYESSQQTVPKFWTMQNGYCFPTDIAALEAVSRFLAPNPKTTLRRNFMNAIEYGIQWNTQVIPARHDVAQIYCSALPIAYSGVTQDKWTNFGTAVLDAAYEATLAVGALLSKERDGQRVKVFLTRVGGGVFGNPDEWITQSIRNACNKFKGYPLDVILVNFNHQVDYAQWKWENDKGTGYNDFDIETSIILETVYRHNPNNTSVRLPTRPQWRFDFQHMTQTNPERGSARHIERVS